MSLNNRFLTVTVSTLPEQGSLRSPASSLTEMAVSPENSSEECRARILDLSNLQEPIR